MHHAKASFVRINATVQGDYLVVKVEDNGLGMLPMHTTTQISRELNSGKTTEERGRGLKNMQTRAGLLGGTLDIKSEKGNGTIIELSIPLS